METTVPVPVSFAARLPYACEPHPSISVSYGAAVGDANIEPQHPPLLSLSLWSGSDHQHRASTPPPFLSLGSGSEVAREGGLRQTTGPHITVSSRTVQPALDHKAGVYEPDEQTQKRVWCHADPRAAVLAAQRPKACWGSSNGIVSHSWTWGAKSTGRTKDFNLLGAVEACVAVDPVRD